MFIEHWTVVLPTCQDTIVTASLFEARGEYTTSCWPHEGIQISSFTNVTKESRLMIGDSGIFCPYPRIVPRVLNGTSVKVFPGALFSAVSAHESNEAKQHQNATTRSQSRYVCHLKQILRKSSSKSAESYMGICINH